MTEVDSVIPEGKTSSSPALHTASSTTESAVTAAVTVAAAAAAATVVANVAAAKNVIMPPTDSVQAAPGKAVAGSKTVDSPAAGVDGDTVDNSKLMAAVGGAAAAAAGGAAAVAAVKGDDVSGVAMEEDSQATTTSTENGDAAPAIDASAHDESPADGGEVKDASVTAADGSEPAADDSKPAADDSKPTAAAKAATTEAPAIAEGAAAPIANKSAVVAATVAASSSSDKSTSSANDAKSTTPGAVVDEQNSSSSSSRQNDSGAAVVAVAADKPTATQADGVNVDDVDAEAKPAGRTTDPPSINEASQTQLLGAAVAKLTSSEVAAKAEKANAHSESAAAIETKKANGTAVAAVVPMDATAPSPPKPLQLTVEKQKENGVVDSGIVNLDDDSEDEEEEEDNDEEEALPLTVKKPVNSAANGSSPVPKAAAKLNDSDANRNHSNNKSVCSDSDGAVVIGSDSETESVMVPARPLPPLLPPRDLKATAPPLPLPLPLQLPQVIDDDDDDCVVIEDDTPAPLMASDLSKRKSGVLGSPSNSDDSQPPHKRQRNGGVAQNMSQITIKDARSLMPQEIGTKRAADGNIYPVTITPAHLPQQQQGPPKLVPMSNVGVLPPMPLLPGLTCNANLLPGLTDDMFVLEAPSFIVPYIYEKPPLDQLKDIIRVIQNKYGLSREELAEADKPDEFDMMTEQNRDDKEEKAAGSSANKRKRKHRGGDDESWSEESDEDEDDDDDSESGMRTKVLIKEASDDLNVLKSVIKPASAVAQAASSGAPLKPGQENYFESPLGKFFMDIGVGQVQEFVQTDLIRLQKRKMRKSLGNNIGDFERAISALSGNLEASKRKNTPFKFTLKRCEFCNFKSESALAMANHYETPHMHGQQYKCNFCTFEIRNATEIVYHMEAMHNIKARLIKPLPYHQCPNCGFEDNGKAKLSRHQPVCAKKFRPEINLAPPTDWEAPAKIPRIKPRHGLVGTATAYQAMAAQAAAQKAALASIQQQQQQAAQARSLQAAALAAQNAANKIRGRPPMLQKPNVGGPNGGPGVVGAASLLRGPNQVRSPMATNVVLPNNYQLAGGQLIQQAANAMAKKNLSGQPSISITPLPRQSAATPAAAPSTSKLPPAGMKPGQNPNPVGGKTQFVICEICDGYIKDLEQLRNHMQWMHKVKIHPKMIYNRPPLNCQKCQFRFFTDQGLERHLLGSHGLVTSSMQEAANKGKDAGRCPVCGRMYQWKLLNHVSRDHHMTLKPAHLSYKCTVCTATFGMYKQFETHVYTAHSTVAKKAMDGRKGNAAAPSAPVGSASNNNRSSSGLSVTNDSLLKPLKINDEITIIPQPASKPRITNMESHIID